jgi:hypothetical protein
MPFITRSQQPRVFFASSDALRLRQCRRFRVAKIPVIVYFFKLFDMRVLFLPAYYHYLHFTPHQWWKISSCERQHHAVLVAGLDYRVSLTDPRVRNKLRAFLLARCYR